MTTSRDVKIRCYLDFDGTLSNRKGGETVFTDLYRSIQIRPEAQYDSAKFKEEKVIIETLKAGLKQDENKSMGMAPGAVQFLQKMIELNADIVIISKNREQYIKAMLQIEGLSKETIDEKIKIYDVRKLSSSFGTKQTMVATHEKENPPAEIYVVADDDRADFNLMTSYFQGDNALKLIAHQPAPPMDDDDTFWSSMTAKIVSRVNELAEQKIPDLKIESSTGLIMTGELRIPLDALKQPVSTKSTESKQTASSDNSSALTENPVNQPDVNPPRSEADSPRHTK